MTRLRTLLLCSLAALLLTCGFMLFQGHQSVSADVRNPYNWGSAIATNSEYNLGTCTTAATVNPLRGNRQRLTLTAGQTCALTFMQPTSGTVSVQLKVIQSSGGSFNGAISGGKWPGGTVPTITATSGAVDFLSCYLDGTSAYCVPSQDLR